MMMMERTTKYGTDTVMVISSQDDNAYGRKPAGVNAIRFLLGVASFLFVAGGYALMTLKHGSNFLISSSSASFVEDDTTTSMVTPSDLHATTSSSRSSERAVDDDRSILLLRHAKSSWKGSNSGLSDEQRPLLARGVEEATRLGIYLEKHHVPVPDIIYSSPSVRTRQTLNLVQKHWATNVPVQYMDELYDDNFASSSYIDICRSFDNSHHHQDEESHNHHRIMLVGHNPAIQTTAMQLVSNDKKASSSGIDRLFDEEFPTAGFVEIEFRNNNNKNKGHDDDNKGWEYVVDQSNGMVTMFVTPSMT